MRVALLLITTVVFSVWPQLVLKWQVTQLSPMPEPWLDRMGWGLAFVLRPWMLTCFASGFLAFVSWSAVLREIPLSRAYPFLGLSFILVVWLSAVFFGESLTVRKVAGTLLVVAGIALASQG